MAMIALLPIGIGVKLYRQAGQINAGTLEQAVGRSSPAGVSRGSS